MLRGLCLVLLASACFAGGAQAQAVEVPRAYAIPLPPNANPEPQWELGMRYWYSEGSTRFDINSSQRAPILGNPTSTLTYDGIDANSLEFVWAVRNEARTFFNASAPAGVFTLTPPSFLESLPPTKRIVPLEKVATISPVFFCGS